MQKVLLALLVAAPLTAADAKTTPKQPKEPPAAALTHAGDICKNFGGFGRVFGRGYGHVDAVASDDWAPFEKLTIEPGRITAEASFRGTTDTIEGDAEKADKFLKALDHAVTGKHHFPNRETSGSAVRFSSSKDGGGTSLVLEQEQELIIATCSGG